jgi:hypothetical protein
MSYITEQQYFSFLHSSENQYGRLGGRISTGTPFDVLLRLSISFICTNYTQAYSLINYTFLQVFRDDQSVISL